MRHKARSIAGYQRCVLANAHSHRLVIDYPAADKRVAIAKLRQRPEGLTDGGLVIIGSAGRVNHLLPGIASPEGAGAS